MIIKELLSSKKWVTALLSVLGGIAIKYGLPETTVAELTAILSPALMYIGGQAYVDNAKEKKSEGL
jgi:hypothetical protein